MSRRVMPRPAGMNWRLVACAVALVACAGAVLADDETHTYEDDEPVVLWLNKVGPYHNPQETYSYYHLPFCRPEAELEPASKFSSFGVILDGSQFINSNVAVNFKRESCGSLAVPACCANTR